MSRWTLRCRGPAGQTTLPDVNPDMNVADFLDLLAAKTGVPSRQQQLLVGFPPKPVQLPDEPANALLSSLPIVNGDSITVSAAPAKAELTPPPEPAVLLPPPVPAAQPVGTGDDNDEDAELAMAIAASLADVPGGAAPASSQAPARPAAAPASGLATNGHGPAASTQGSGVRETGTARAGPGPGAAGGAAATSVALTDHSGRAVVRRVIDSDNSCLFNAVGYVMDNSRSRAPELRRLIAQTVRADPFAFNEGFLGMENDKYCHWISQSDKWGGAIELSILCQHYGREIAAYDIQTCRCDVYGQDAGYSERVLLLYDGLHYDAMAVCAFEGAPEHLDMTIYEPGSSDAAAIEKAAAQLVESCHRARQFTDTSNFTLRCGVCQIGLKGEKEAVEHAKTTGHQNFSEY